MSLVILVNLVILVIQVHLVKMVSMEKLLILLNLFFFWWQCWSWSFRWIWWIWQNWRFGWFSWIWQFWWFRLIWWFGWMWWFSRIKWFWWLGWLWSLWCFWWIWWAKIHYILFYLDCEIYVGYCHFRHFMWVKCGIVCQIFMCWKISTKMWDKCGLWEKVKLKQIVRDSLCGMNVGLVCVLPCWRCGVNVGFSLTAFWNGLSKKYIISFLST